MFTNIQALLSQMLPMGERLDAGETAMFEHQLRHVIAKLYETDYATIKSRQFIPILPGVHNGAETIKWDLWDSVGMAQLIANYADDLPSVSAFSSENISRIVGVGDSYQYSIQDVRRSAKAGSPLQTQKAKAARERIEYAIDDVLARGVSALGITGMVNNANVSLVAADVGSWSLATAPLGIVRDLNKLVSAVVTQSKEHHIPDTLLLATTDFQIIAGMPMSVDNPTTVLRYFLSTSPYIKNIDSWWKLDLANEGGTNTRAVAYKRSPDILEGVVPQEFEQFTPQVKDLRFHVPCHARVGGTIVYRPLGMAYMDPHG